MRSRAGIAPIWHEFDESRPGVDHPLRRLMGPCSGHLFVDIQESAGPPDVFPAVPLQDGGHGLAEQRGENRDALVLGIGVGGRATTLQATGPAQIQHEKALLATGGGGTPPAQRRASQWLALPRPSALGRPRLQ